MGITRGQKVNAEAQQWAAAIDTASQVRLVAGPGTGKTHAIQKKFLKFLGKVPTRKMSMSSLLHERQAQN